MQEISIGAEQLSTLKPKLLEKLDALKGGKILVVGDVGLDAYVEGNVERISQEAPVPVLDVAKEDHRIGLAGNVAQNIASLGGQPILLSVVGEDDTAEQLTALLTEAGVDASHMITDSERPTTRKLRVMSGHHHIVRVDFERRHFISQDVEQRLLAKAEQLIPSCEGLIIEDYAKGSLSENGIQKLIAIAEAAGKKVMADPAPKTPTHFYKGVQLMTPNRHEAFVLAGIEDDERFDDPKVILKVGQALRDQLQAENMIVTRGKEGMSLFEGDQVTHLPTYARQVFDVTGAGDTVIASLALAWCSGFSLTESCLIANHAAGIVVAKIGCVPCGFDELKTSIQTR